MKWFSKISIVFEFIKTSYYLIFKTLIDINHSVININKVKKY